uniref:hypothetical protein n=1 Tax=Tahibacter caeni TaxID=1453545 RepID=UPI00214759E4
APPAASAAPAPSAAPSPPAGASSGASTVLPFPPVRRPAGTWIPLLAAASVALAVGLAAGRFWSAAPDALVPTTLLSVDRMRSVSTVPTLRLPADGMVVLSVPVAAEPGCTPTVRILQDGRRLEAQAAPDDFGFANLSLAATQLAPGKAEVTVDCGGQQRASYPVEFVR